MAFLTPDGRMAACGEPSVVQRAMPYGVAQVEAARRLGLAEEGGAEASQGLRESLLRLSQPSASAPGGDVRLRGLGLRLGYNGRVVLDGADLELRSGEILAVLGRNGSGKSSLLRGLIGLEKLQGGEVWLDGHRIDLLPTVARAREVAFVPQWPAALLFAETVRAELDLTLAKSWPAGRAADCPRRIARASQPGRSLRALSRDLSAGERQRAALAR